MFAWLGKWQDVVGHLVLYGVLGPLLLISLWSWVADPSYRVKWALVAVGLGILHGLLDEYHQSFVPGRTATAIDVFIDSVGVVISVAVVWYVVRGVCYSGAGSTLVAAEESCNGVSRFFAPQSLPLSAAKG